MTEKRRRFKRISLLIPIHYRIRGKPDFDNGLSDNISEGGCAFKSYKFIPRGSLLMLELEILKKVIYPIGRVVWCQFSSYSERNRVGVEFVEFDPLEKAFLSDYINMFFGKEINRKEEK